MTQPLVLQLRFTRSEFKRGLEGLSGADACRRIEPMNCISWNIGHLAWQEQRYWLQRLQDKTLLPEIAASFAYGCSPSTPPLDEALQAWYTIIAAVDPFLDTLSADDLLRERTFTSGGGSLTTTVGTMMLRMIYHYWYHNGENQAIRQILRHEGLQDFVGDISTAAPYRG
ncbi:MAG: DinB family protein [Chloroflexales bacterium]|nr:DinB family protein [Chloroflexales bacterium]